MRPPARPEIRADARRKLEDITDRLRKRLPEGRHADRMRAFYVDVTDPGGWSRPVDAFTREKAEDVLTQMRNDYALQWDNLQPDRMRSLVDPRLADALEAWPDRPPLPPPPGPWDPRS